MSPDSDPLRSEEAEYAYVFCLARHPEKRIAQAIIAKTKLEWFSDNSCACFWKAIENLLKCGLKVDQLDPNVISAEMSKLRRTPRFKGSKKWFDFISEAGKDCLDEDAEETIFSLAKVLKDLYVARLVYERIQTFGNGLVKKSNKGDVVESLVSDLNTILVNEADTDEADTDTSIDNVINAVEQVYAEREVSKNWGFVPGIYYPWQPLSKCLGGLQAGLHFIGARPSVGKTAFVLQCMDYWLRMGYRIKFNCLDMEKEAVIKRLICYFANVPLSVASGTYGHLSADDLKRIKKEGERIKTYERMGLLSISKEKDIDRFAADCAVRLMSKRLDIVIVDYVQKMHKDKLAGQEYADLTYVSDKFKALANQYHAPIILLSQFSRVDEQDRSKDRRDGSQKLTMAPGNHVLRGSGALEQDATTIIMLYKDEGVDKAWHPDTDTETDGGGIPESLVPPIDDPDEYEATKAAITPIWVAVTKNQNGATKQFPFICYRTNYSWFMGDMTAQRLQSGADRYRPKFERLMVDWRYGQPHMSTIEKMGGLVKHKGWQKDLAWELGRLGLPVPDKLGAMFSDDDKEHYAAMLAEREKRLRGEVVVPTIEEKPLKVENSPEPELEDDVDADESPM